MACEADLPRRLTRSSSIALPQGSRQGLRTIDWTVVSTREQRSESWRGPHPSTATTTMVWVEERRSARPPSATPHALFARPKLCTQQIRAPTPCAQSPLSCSSFSLSSAPRSALLHLAEMYSADAPLLRQPVQRSTRIGAAPQAMDITGWSSVMFVTAHVRHSICSITLPRDLTALFVSSDINHLSVFHLHACLL